MRPIIFTFLVKFEHLVIQKLCKILSHVDEYSNLFCSDDDFFLILKTYRNDIPNNGCHVLKNKNQIGYVITCSPHSTITVPDIILFLFSFFFFVNHPVYIIVVGL